MKPSYMTIRNAVLGAWANVAEVRRNVNRRSGATVVALLLTAIAPHARAVSCSVSNNTDAGANSLRECLADSNGNDPGANGSNVINANGAQTITSPTGGINITRSVEIGTGGDALVYQTTGGTVGFVIPAGTSGIHLVLGENLTFSANAPGPSNISAVSINNGGNTLDVDGQINISTSVTAYGVNATGDNNAINVSGAITGPTRGGAGIRTSGNQNTINVSGTVNVASNLPAGGAVWVTGDRNIIDVSGSITNSGGLSHAGISTTGNDNQINVSGLVSTNTSVGIGVVGDNNNINVRGSVNASSNAIRIASGTNNSLTVEAGGNLSSNTGSTTVTFLGVGTSSLTNYGTISGDVIMSDGGSTVSMATGSTIGGTVNGGASGNNVLRLIGNGTDSYDGRFTNFQVLEVNTGGMWSLENNQSYTNGVNLLNGTLAVNGVVTGAIQIHNGRLQGTGTIGGTTNFAGGIIAPGNSIGTLRIDGGYTGSDGTLEIEGQLAGTGSPADRLLVSGNATGATMVHVINTGGNGALTDTGNTDGISIIQVAGTSTADAFQLAGGYAAAGPYQYKLHAFDSASSAIGELDSGLAGAPSFYDYRLQSVVDASGNPVAVPQIAGYQALPTGAVRYGASLLDSVHQRLGELRRLGAAGNGGDGQNNEFFLRAQGSGGDVSGNRASGYDQDIWFTQVGGNVFGKDMEDGSTLRIGGAFSYGESKLNVDNSSAKVNLEGTALALTSTYQAASGWYLDGVAQVTKYSVDIKTSERGQTGSPDGLGYALSLEGGYPFDLGNGLVIEPQAQLSYQKIKFDRFTDVDSVSVDLRDGESLRGRFGGRIQKTFDANTVRAWSPFMEINLLHEFLGAGSIRTSGVSFASDSLGTSLQLGGGINAQMGANKMVFASASYESGLSDAAANVWSGNVGMRINF